MNAIYTTREGTRLEGQIDSEHPHLPGFYFFHRRGSLSPLLVHRNNLTVYRLGLPIPFDGKIVPEVTPLPTNPS